MDQLREAVDGWLAFALACRSYLPEFGIGALIALAWSLMRRHLPHVRRWAVRRDKRHYIEVAIVFLFTVFVTGSAYVDLYQKTSSDFSLKADIKLQDFSNMSSVDLDVPLYLHNNGNRSILVQEIGIYVVGYNSYGLSDRIFLNSCLSDDTKDILTSMPDMPRAGQIMRYKENLVYYTAPAAMNFGSPSTLTSLAVLPKSEATGVVNFHKHALGENDIRAIDICPVFRFFDENAQSRMVVCKGNFAQTVVANGFNGYSIGANPPQYRLMPDLDPAVCRKVR